MVIPKTLVQLVFLIGLVLLGVGIYQRQLMPDYQTVLASTLKEPIQTNAAKAPFKVTVKGVEYTIKPLADYEITGVIVSRHDTSTFWDYIHKETNDHINVADLCIVWGQNLTSNNYKQLSYSNGQFTCNVSTKSEAIWSAFDQNALSNNHLLTDEAGIAKRVRKFKVGDQVRVKGYLSIYTHTSGMNYERGTSLVRNDSGNGACETIFVTQAELLQPTSSLPHWLRAVGWVVLALSTVAWFRFTGYGGD
jgi:hypothetical protein